MWVSVSHFLNSARLNTMKSSLFPLWALCITASFLPIIGYAASPGDVIFNEIAWMGSEVSGVEVKNWWRYEWIELYNKTDQAIDLTGWQLELAGQEVGWTLGLKGTIPPRSYFLIVSSDKIPNFDLNYAKLDGKLNNGGQKISLRDAEKNIIDGVDARNNWFDKGDNTEKKTMERKSFTSSSNDPLNWGTSLEKGGTPRSANSVGEVALSAAVVATQTPAPTLIPTPTQTPVTTPTPTPTPTPTTTNTPVATSPVTPSPSSVPTSSPVYAETPTTMPLPEATQLQAATLSTSHHAMPRVLQNQAFSAQRTSTPQPEKSPTKKSPAAYSPSISAVPREMNGPTPEREETLAAVSGATTKPLMLSTGILLMVVLGTLGVLWKYVMK